MKPDYPKGPEAPFRASTTVVTDYTGALVEDRLFYPWGQDWQIVGTLYEERFAKLQHRDNETSLDPTPNRMFSSQEGRWLSPDPLFGDISNPQTLNLYPYVAGNPASRIDPKGTILIDPTGIGCIYGADTAGYPAAFCTTQDGASFPIFLPLLLGAPGCGSGGQCQGTGTTSDKPTLSILCNEGDTFVEQWVPPAGCSAEQQDKLAADYTVDVCQKRGKQYYALCSTYASLVGTGYTKYCDCCIQKKR
jgi:RHS repeat-associated protein